MDADAVKVLLTEMRKEMEEQSSKQMLTLVQSFKDVMTESKQGTMQHDEKINKPSQFRGEEKRYNEWMIKLLSYLRSKYVGCDEFIKMAMSSDKIVTTSMLMSTSSLPKAEEFSTKLHSIIMSLCEDTAFTIVQAAPTGNGLECLRLLKKRFDPKSPGTKRAILKSLMTMQPCTKITEIEAKILKVEELIKKYTDMSGIILPDDLICMTFIELCNGDLKQYLELSTSEMDPENVRKEILNYVERKRNIVNDQFVDIEVDAVQKTKVDEHYGYDPWGNDGYLYDWPEHEYEEISYFGGKGGGKNYGGKGGKSFSWDSGKGKGKSFMKGGYQGAKGGNYGNYKGGKGSVSDGKGGKGKGTSGFQGECYWCGKFGHSQRDCADKDAYMNSQREMKSREGLSSVEEGAHKECDSLEKIEQTRNCFWLASLEKYEPKSYVTKNPFQNLYSEHEDIEVPPGLEDSFTFVAKRKMPKVSRNKWNLIDGQGVMSQKKYKVKESVFNGGNGIDLCLNGRVSTSVTSGMHNCIGHDATCRGLATGGFKSPGRCSEYKRENSNDKMREISSIEEIFEVSNIESDNDEYIDMTVDSGASDTVANRDIAPNCEVVPSEGSRKGVKYVAAAGKTIPNEGEKRVRTETAEGHLCNLKIQITAVNKALLSVSKICDAGHEVIFTKLGGRIVHCETGQVINFRRVDGVYRLRLKVVGTASSGFTRPGM